MTSSYPLLSSHMDLKAPFKSFITQSVSCSVCDIVLRIYYREILKTC